MIAPAASRPPGATPAARLSRFMARYGPAVVKAANEARGLLRQRMAGANALLYNNYNALVIGDGPTDKASDAVLSIALYPRW